MNILVFGHSGQVATELRDLDGAGIRITALDRASADLTDPAACAARIDAHAPDAVISAAAYTAVDKAESDAATADLINAKAMPVGRRVIPLIRREFMAAPNIAIEAAGGRWAMLRTSWVVSAHGNNFVKTMPRIGEVRNALTVVSDQIGGPTGAAEIAQTCITIAKTLVSEPKKIWRLPLCRQPRHQLGQFCPRDFDQAGITCAVIDIPSSDYPTAATRPLNSRMDCSATTVAFGTPRPDWCLSLTQILTQLDIPKD
jgi:dTDP-4-dehydrorhamnose reductase